jgi:hypothetical protein
LCPIFSRQCRIRSSENKQYQCPWSRFAKVFAKFFFSTHLDGSGPIFAIFLLNVKTGGCRLTLLNTSELRYKKCPACLLLLLLSK